MNRHWLSLALLLLCSEVANSETFRVPSEVLTIQAALDSIAAGDTILVASGLYSEPLLAPALQFVLKGEIDPDSGSASRPMLIPSQIPGLDTLPCLRLPELSRATIEDLQFKNRIVSVESSGMGIWSRASVTLRRCVFDSTRRGLHQQCCPDQEDIVDSLFDCVFRHTLLIGVNALDYPVIAERCIFESGAGLRFCSVGDGSIFRNCHFDGGGSSALVLNGNPMEVSNCTFGPSDFGGGQRIAMVQGLGQVFIRNNTFIGNIVSVAVIRARGGVANSFFIEDNVFADNQAGPNGGCIQLYTQDAFVPNIGGTIQNNVFLNCFARQGGSNFIDCDADMIIQGNRFEETAADEFHSPAISVLHGESTVIHNNDFIGTDYALFTEAVSLHAENNWWGHNSGPYHETLNPAGQGDTIRGEPVDFEPWELDTITGVTPPQPLPLIYRTHAYPNPFNNEVTIEFVTTKREQIRLQIFDLMGRLVETIAEEELAIGVHRRSWNVKNNASGIYFARLSSTASAQRAWLHKLVLLK